MLKDKKGLPLTRFFVFFVFYHSLFRSSTVGFHQTFHLQNCMQAQIHSEEVQP